jgi:hypothetical protein
MRKKLTTLITAAVLLFALPLTAFAASFGDVKDSHWAYEAVEGMAEAGVINGFPDGSFKPADTVTYGEFIKMAYLAAGGADPGSAKEGNWASGYHEAAVAAGFFSKYDIAASALSYSIPREYMALVLSGILGDATIEDYGAIRGNISDVDTNTPHEDDIIKVYAAGLITGYPDETFKPSGTLNRAEAATVIHRLLNIEKRVTPEIPEEEKLPEFGEKTQVERLVGSTGNSSIGNVADTSTATNSLSDIVDLDPAKLQGVPKGDSAEIILEDLAYYEIFENYPYKMASVKNLLDRTGIDMGSPLGSAFAFMIKGRTLTLLSSGHNSEIFMKGGDSDIPADFDYIGIRSVDHTTLLLIPNNL